MYQQLTRPVAHESSLEMSGELLTHFPTWLKILDPIILVRTVYVSKFRTVSDPQEQKNRNNRVCHLW
jgi:hypothetical protein